jgi:hypothetical protein
MKRWMAAVAAVLTVILSSFVGMIVGAIVGNLIVPADLFDDGGNLDTGLLLVGVILGLLGGFYFGIWAAMGIVAHAAAKRHVAQEFRDDEV